MTSVDSCFAVFAHVTSMR